MAERQSWQHHLDPPLVQRLWRPIAQPGAMDGRMVERLFHRYYDFLTPAPLLQTCLQRQSQTAQAQAGTVPIVYAQPWSLPEATPARAPIRDSNPPPEVAPPLPATLPNLPRSQTSPVIQAKLDPSASAAALDQPLPLAAPDNAETAHSPQTRDRAADPIPLPSPEAAAPMSAGSGQPVALPVVRPTRVAPVAEAWRSIVVRDFLPQSDGEQQSPIETLAPDRPLPLVTVGPPVDRAVNERAESGAGVVTSSGGQTRVPGEELGRAIASPVVQPLPPQRPGTFSPSTQAFTLPLAPTAAAGLSASSGTGQPAMPPQQAASSRTAVPIVSGQPVQVRTPPTEPSPPPASPPVNLEQLTEQVERRLRRKMIVERERRGWQR